MDADVLAKTREMREKQNASFAEYEKTFPVALSKENPLECVEMILDGWRWTNPADRKKRRGPAEAIANSEIFPALISEKEAKERELGEIEQAREELGLEYLERLGEMVPRKIWKRRGALLESGPWHDDFLRLAEWIGTGLLFLFYGGSGTGKTQMSVELLAYGARSRNLKPTFLTFAQILEQYNGAKRRYGEGLSAADYIERLTELQLLAIDNIEAAFYTEKGYGEGTWREAFCAILQARYDNGLDTILTMRATDTESALNSFTEPIREKLRHNGFAVNTDAAWGIFVTETSPGSQRGASTKVAQPGASEVCGVSEPGQPGASDGGPQSTNVETVEAVQPPLMRYGEDSRG